MFSTYSVFKNRKKIYFPKMVFQQVLSFWSDIGISFRADQWKYSKYACYTWYIHVLHLTWHTNYSSPEPFYLILMNQTLLCCVSIELVAMIAQVFNYSTNCILSIEWASIILHIAIRKLDRVTPFISNNYLIKTIIIIAIVINYSDKYVMQHNTFVFLWAVCIN